MRKYRKNTKEPLSVLIKPSSGDCNLSCKYCFYLRSSDVYPETGPHRMSEAVLDATVRQLLEVSHPVASFAWQGGEPLLMGLDFFKQAVNRMRLHGAGHQVSNGLQTNGVALDDDWAEFLARYRFLVGVSLDGPEKIHNTFRGKTFDKVIAGTEALARHKVEFNILSVVNSLSAQHPETIFDFMVEKGFQHLQFIPCMEESEKRHETEGHPVSPEALGDFLCRLFDVWYERGYPDIHIRLFDNVLEYCLGITPGSCQLREKCGSYVVIEYNGDVYPCDFFVYPEWKLGNIMEKHLGEIIQEDKFAEFSNSKAKLRKRCRKCEWSSLCNGGCSRTRYFRREIFEDLDYFCPAYHKFYDHTAKRFKKLAEDIRNRHGINRPNQS